MGKKEKSFVHCHTHTSFSMLDGKANVDELVAKVAEEGQPAIACTDHGNMFGAYEIYKTAKKYGVKPLIGSELYLAPGETSRRDKTRIQWGNGGEDDVSGGGAYTHLTVLAENNEGMHNLFKVSSESYKTGYYYKPRCLTPGQKISTKMGKVDIEKVRLGDLVLTHTGEYCRVVATMQNRHDGLIYDIYTNFTDSSPILSLTGEHPLLVHDLVSGENRWVEAQQLFVSDVSNQRLCIPKLNNKNNHSQRGEVIKFNTQTYLPNYAPIPHSTNEWVKLGESINYPLPPSVTLPHQLIYDEKLATLVASAVGASLWVETVTGNFSHKVHLALPGQHHGTLGLVEIIANLTQISPEDVLKNTLTPSRVEGVKCINNNPLLEELLTNMTQNILTEGNFSWVFTSAPESFTRTYLEKLWNFLENLAGMGKFNSSTLSAESIIVHICTQIEKTKPTFAAQLPEQFLCINKAVSPDFWQNGADNDTCVALEHTENYALVPIAKISTRQYHGMVYNFETQKNHSYVANVTVHNCDRELLSEHSKGVIATTGCPSGEVQTRLRLGQTQEALQAAATYRDIFGKDNYFVELMDHGLALEKRTKDGLLWIAKQLQLPLLATNDLHYVNRSDAKSHEDMLCVQSGSTLSNPSRFKFDAEEFYLKTASEMRALFPEESFPGACDNTLLIAERSNVTFNENADLMPRFPVPEGETLDSWFEKEVMNGLQRRYPGGVPDHHRRLAEYEVSVIKNMGYSGYFLVTADFIMWAKKQGIRVGPGRGCLRGDTLITTKNGNKEIRNITTEDFVLDGNGDWVNPSAVQMYECDEKLTGLEIGFKGILYLTNDHEVLKVKTFNNDGSSDETEWVRADSVEPGDFLCDPTMKTGKGKYKPVKVIGTHKGILGDGRVYDLTIPTTSSYVASGIVVHNSAAGSLVAYAMGITEIDPVQHNLIFERFLNPDRVTMPDIDIDFDDTRRGEVINYVTEKYGKDKVAHIVTFSIVKAKAAIKDAARILDQPFKTADAISKLYPPAVMGKTMPLKDVFDEKSERYKEAEDLRKLYNTDAISKKIIDTALGLEGVTRQWTVHAAGILLSAEPLTDHIPVLKRESDGTIITQFDQKTCETLGLLKMDFLGLRNLKVLDEAIELIRETKKITIIPEDIPYDDPTTYKLLTHGDTLGVFQLDSPPMRALLKSMRPDNFEDISAVLALYRPGPMAMNSHNEYADRKNKRKPILPIHPELEKPLSEILGNTYGLCIYQEQVQRIAQELAGFTPGRADLLRRAMGKKDKEILDEEYKPFREGMLTNGYSEEAAKRLWDVLVPFADYAFNKSHTVAYGTLSYWTAYLKANYPAEYMSALLTSVGDDKDKTALYISECRRMGIKLLPPDVNESGAHYTPVSDKEIRVGLSAIRNVGLNVVNQIVEARKEKGPFTSFDDFLRKVPPQNYNKRTVDSLIKAAAFSQLHPNRAALSFVHADAVDIHTKLSKKTHEGQSDLFIEFSEETGGSHAELFTIPNIPEWDRVKKLGFEREMLGKYITDHPLRGYQQSAVAQADDFILKLFPIDEQPPKTRAKVAGVVTNVLLRKTKKGDSYATVTIEDMTSSIDVTFFPTSWETCAETIENDAFITAIVKVDYRDDGSYSLLGSDARRIQLEPDPQGYSFEEEMNPTPLLTVITNENLLTPQMVQNIKAAIERNPGEAYVRISVTQDNNKTVVYELPTTTDHHKTSWELKGLFGEEAVQISRYHKS